MSTSYSRYHSYLREEVHCTWYLYYIFKSLGTCGNTGRNRKHIALQAQLQRWKKEKADLSKSFTLEIHLIICHFCTVGRISLEGQGYKMNNITNMELFTKIREYFAYVLPLFCVLITTSITLMLLLIMVMDCSTLSLNSSCSSFCSCTLFSSSDSC